MNAIKETLSVYKNYLIGNETDEEDFILMNAIYGAITWRNKVSDRKKEKEYFSSLSLNENMELIIKLSGYSADLIHKSKEQKCVLFRKIFCYISSRSHKAKEIAYFLEKDRTTVLFSIESIKSYLSIGDKYVDNILSNIMKIINKI